MELKHNSCQHFFHPFQNLPYPYMELKPILSVLFSIAIPPRLPYPYMELKPFTSKVTFMSVFLPYPYMELKPWYVSSFQINLHTTLSLYGIETF